MQGFDPSPKLYCVEAGTSLFMYFVELFIAVNMTYNVLWTVTVCIWNNLDTYKVRVTTFKQYSLTAVLLLPL